MSTPEASVAWRSFEPSAFAAAESTDRPILLSLTAHWCRPCHEMDETAYADPELAATINEQFIPIRADIDRRPDVANRYEMGGFPSTVFLTPAGHLLTGATYLSADALQSVVERVNELWRMKGQAAGRIPRRLRTTPPSGTLSPDFDRHFLATLRETFDEDHGGWGTDAKYPYPAAIEFCLSRAPALATRTLDPIRHHLVDTYDGGFFRSATNRDWSDPHREKLTAENARLLRAFATAYLHTGDTAYRDTASEAVTYLTSTLWDGDAFASSQAPMPPSYYHQAAADREAAPQPPIDDTPYAGPNALAIEALLTYTAVTGDAIAREYAERALAFLTDSLLKDGSVQHTPDQPTPTGLLADQAQVLRALTTAAQVLDPDYRRRAQAVADQTLTTLRTPDGFVDHPHDGPGLLDRPLYPIDGAATLANALVDIATLTDEQAYREAATDALEAFADGRDRFGAGVATFATAASRVQLPPLRIDVGTRPGSDLHRAARRIADHEKIIRLPGSAPDGTATATFAGATSPPATTPEELTVAVASIAK